MKTMITSSIAVFVATILASTVLADESKESVNVSNFVRAESDHMIRSNIKAAMWEPTYCNSARTDSATALGGFKKRLGSTRLVAHERSLSMK